MFDFNIWYVVGYEICGLLFAIMFCDMTLDEKGKLTLGNVLYSLIVGAVVGAIGFLVILGIKLDNMSDIVIMRR